MGIWFHLAQAARNEVLKTARIRSDQAHPLEEHDAGFDGGIMGNRTAGRSVSTGVSATLTDKAIKAFVGKAGRGEKLADGGGLYLINAPAGGTTWRVKYRINGRERTYSIGPYPLVTLAAARVELGEIKARLLEHKDPEAKRLLHLGPRPGRRS